MEPIHFPSWSVDTTSSSDLELDDIASSSSSSSDTDEEHLMLHYQTMNNKRKRVFNKKRKFINRGREAGHARLMEDYFADSPTYGEELFRRRYRMSRSLFCRIMNDVVIHDRYFIQTTDNSGRQSFSPHQKITAALRMLCYGAPADAVDEYVRMGESTCIKALRRYVKSIVEIYSAKYLRSPTQDDTNRILQVNARRGFPGMLGSIDCMHWEWKNCPTAWAGMYKGHCSAPTIILKAVATYDLWIWHAFFGMPSSLNDLNVLGRSHVFREVLNGSTPISQFVVNGNIYDRGYYLADGIYPS